MRVIASLSVDDWVTFWPAFIATAAGVVLGIPAGLLLNTLVAQFSSRKTRATDAERLSDTLFVIIVSLDVNETALTRLQEKLATSVLFSHGFDLATWDMAKPDVQELVKPIDYRIPLAQYFEDVRQLLKIVDDLNRYSVGVNSALVAAPTIREAFIEHLQTRIPLAVEKGRWLREQIVKLDGLLTLKHPLDAARPVSKS